MNIDKIDSCIFLVLHYKTTQVGENMLFKSNSYRSCHAVICKSESRVLYQKDVYTFKQLEHNYETIIVYFVNQILNVCDQIF